VTSVVGITNRSCYLIIGLRGVIRWFQAGLLVFGRGLRLRVLKQHENPTLSP